MGKGARNAWPYPPDFVSAETLAHLLDCSRATIDNYVRLAESVDRTAELLPRKRQQNIKVSEDCSAVFAAIAEMQGFSKAALFEDMVAERLELLQRQGLKLGSG